MFILHYTLFGEKKRKGSCSFMSKIMIILKRFNSCLTCGNEKKKNHNYNMSVVTIVMINSFLLVVMSNRNIHQLYIELMLLIYFLRFILYNILYFSVYIKKMACDF